MACATASDSTDSDMNIGPSKNHSSSGKRVVSSDEETIDLPSAQWNQTTSSATRKATATPNQVCSDGRRQSLRKRRTKFQMPSREEQWGSIPTASKVTNKLSCLKPRKLINDFTRITHRYNYDYEEVSGEESMEEFIKGTDSSESSESREAGKSKRRKVKEHRVKGYRPRIVKQADESSDDSGQDSPELEHDAKENLRRNPHSKDVDQQESKQSEAQLHKKQKTPKGKVQNAASSDEDVQPVATPKKTRRKSMLDSDDEEHSQGSSSNPVSLKEIKRSKKTSVLISDNDEDKKSDEEDSQDIGGSLKRSRTRSAIASESESEEKDSVTEKASSCKAVVSPDKHCNKPQYTQVKSMCGSETPKKHLDASNPSKKDTVMFDDGVITIEDSDSAVSDGDDSATEEDSSDGVECSRIEKLATRKRQRRDSMFDKLKSARAKLQKKT